MKNASSNSNSSSSEENSIWAPIGKASWEFLTGMGDAMDDRINGLGKFFIDAWESFLGTSKEYGDIINFTAKMIERMIDSLLGLPEYLWELLVGLFSGDAYKTGYSVGSVILLVADVMIAKLAAKGLTALAEKLGLIEGKIVVSGTLTVDEFLYKYVKPNFQQSVKDAFLSDIKVTTLAKDTTVYRYSGGTSAGKSYWVTPNKTSNPAADLALPSGNTYSTVTKYIVPKGTVILEGTVAPNFGQPGGGYQYYVPDPSVLN